MKASFAVNGVVKYNTYLDDGKQQLRLRNGKETENSESGFLPLDPKSEFIPLDREVKLVDEATLKFVDEKILETFRCAIANSDRRL